MLTSTSIYKIWTLPVVLLIGVATASNVAFANGGYYRAVVDVTREDYEYGGASEGTYGGVPGETLVACQTGYNNARKPSYGIKMTPMKKNGEWVYKMVLFVGDTVFKCNDQEDIREMDVQYLPVFAPQYHFSWNDSYEGVRVVIKFDMVPLSQK